MTKCKICGGEYVKRSITHRACSVECAIALADQNKIKKKLANEKASRGLFRQRKTANKTLSYWTAQTQAACNAYVRERDKDLPCISCQRHHSGRYHAGHYRSIGSMSTLRFNTANLNKQCAPCNLHKSGNLIEYRINLIKKVGIDVVEFLEGPHDPMKHTVAGLVELKAYFKQQLKTLRGLA